MGILVALVLAIVVIFTGVAVMDQRAKRRRRSLERDDIPITDQLVENSRAAQVTNSIYGMINGTPRPGRTNGRDR